MPQKLFIILIFFLVSACQTNIREAIGFTKESPDEFSVLPQKPLTVPKQFTLPDPDNIVVEPRPVEESFRLEQESTIPPTDLTLSEQALLESEISSSTDSSADIRQLIDQEYQQEESQTEAVLDQLFPWRNRETEDQNNLLDVQKEKERLIKEGIIQNQTILPSEVE